MDDEQVIVVLLGGICLLMSAIFFHLHVTDEGPAQAKAKYKTGSLSLAYGWTFLLFAIAGPGLFLLGSA